MVYAEGRTYYDADSHIMELPDWLVGYADPDIRDRIRPLYLGAAGKLADEAVRDAETRAVDPAAGVALEADVLHRKGWYALGAFDPARAKPRARSARLRLPARVHHVRTDAVPRRRPRPRVRRHAGPQPGDGRLLLRTTRVWCRSGSFPWTARTRRRQRSRKRSTWGAARCCCLRTRRGQPSPTHPDYDPVWAPSRRATSPSCCTSAAAAGSLRRAFHDNGRRSPTSWVAARTSGRRTTW